MFRKENETAETTYLFPLNTPCEIDFRVLDCWVRTREEKELTQYGPLSKLATDPNPPKRWMTATIRSRVEPFDSVLEGSRYARPRLMTVLGIISYLVNCPLLPNQSVSGSSKLLTAERPTEPSTECVLVADGADKSADLAKLIRSVDDPEAQDWTTIISALDRYRRGLFFNSHSQDEPHFEDEAFLCFYHVLELLAFQCRKSQDKELSQKLTDFLKSTLTNPLMMRDQEVCERLPRMTKQFRSVLNGEGAEGIKTAIKYFLHYHNLFSVEAGHLVDKLVRIRNHIAHGKQVCRKDVIWPVPQFFPLDQDTGDYLEVVQTVAGVAISSLLGLAVFQREWRELVRDTSPTKESVATFINDRRFADLSAVDYLKRNENNITPHCIAWFVANKELKLEKLEDATEALWKSGDTCEKFADELLLPAILLSDSNIKAIAEPCRKLITESTELSELKQFYRDLQYRGIELKWLLEFLRSTALDGGGSDSGETA